MEAGVLWASVAMGFIFAFINGFHDGGNVVASSIFSRSLSPRKALAIASAGEFAGPLVFGTAVATTIGKDIISPTVFYADNGRILILSIFVAAIIWNLITWWLGLPSSSSHALIGAMVGAILVAYGLSAVNWQGLLLKVVLVMFITPIIGLILSYFSMNLLTAIFSNFPPGINRLFKEAHPFSITFLAATHGANDAPKAMGLIVLGLTTVSKSNRIFSVPFWVILGGAAAISLGLLTGGWRILRTVGTRICRIEAVHSFNSQLCSAAIIGIAAILGGPVSTTQVVNSSIMGTGASHRLSAVRWHVVRDIFLAWVLTVPAAAFLAGGLFYLATSVCK